jgi:hypothetical protein
MPGRKEVLRIYSGCSCSLLCTYVPVTNQILPTTDSVGTCVRGTECLDAFRINNSKLGSDR